MKRSVFSSTTLSSVMSILLFVLAACEVGDDDVWYSSHETHADTHSPDDAEGALLNKWERTEEDGICLEQRQRPERVDGVTALSHLFVPEDTIDSTDGSEASDAVMSADVIEAVFVETIPCSEDWHCAVGKECMVDGQCMTKLVLIQVLTGYDGSPPPVQNHTGEEATLIFGATPTEEMGLIPNIRWLPLADLCVRGLWVELRDPNHPGFDSGEGCVTAFKNLTIYEFGTRLEYKLIQTSDPDRCQTILHIDKSQFDCTH